MNINVPLTPHQEQFVREQLASGSYQSEGDVIGAALRLLEDRLRADPHVTTAGLRQRLPATAAPGNDRRSPRGILADLRSDISYEEIQEARREMWAGFPRSEPR